MHEHLNIKPKSDSRWDLVSLGEVLLRFDPGDDRVHTARNFRVWEGGGEYNVARNLATCFQIDTAIVTALADNQVGRLVEGLISEGRVDTSEIRWHKTDGISATARNGIYFMERGFGPRTPTGCSDRANTAVSQLTPGDIDWNGIFASKGTRWFHTGGIFSALSESTADVAAEAMVAANAAGAIVSYDLNYRDSLWSGRGGREAANELNRQLLELSDVVFGVENFDPGYTGYSEESFRRATEEMISRHPNLQVACSILRDIHSASQHSLSAVCYADGQVFKAADHANVHVLDRVGSGDAFAAGIIYGLLSGQNLQETVDLACASAVLSLASLGDGSTATYQEIERAAKRSGGPAIR